MGHVNWCGHGPRCGFAVAQVELGGALDGERLDLCYRHLNQYLDSADVYPELEPVKRTFLVPPVDAPPWRWSWWCHDPDVSPRPVGAVRTAA